MGKLKTLLGVTALTALLDVVAAKVLLDYTLRREHLGSDQSQRLTGPGPRLLPPGLLEARRWLERQRTTDILIPSRDGKMLHGRWLPCEGSSRVAICFHGYAGSPSRDCAGLARFYAAQGFHVLLADMRAHGKSEGDVVGLGSLERWDVAAWIRYVRRQPTVRSGQLEIILHGISHGATAVLLTCGLKLPGCVRGVVADSAFTSGWDVYDHAIRTRTRIPPRLLLHPLREMTRCAASFDLSGLNTAHEIQKATVPVLLIHGEADRLAPVAMARRIYDACAAPIHLLTIPDADHMEPYRVGTERYEQTLGIFLERVLRPQNS